MASKTIKQLEKGCGEELISYVDFDKNIELDTFCGDFELEVNKICYCGKCEAILKAKKEVLELIKPIIKKHCMGTSANCYNLYQEIKKEIEE
tara:strand:+ start:17 stop:292 length:276 start_codon:yes stop_codon:yes gene_type:complete